MLIIIAVLITVTTSSITVIYAVNDAETKTPSRLCSFGACSVSPLVQVHSGSLLGTVIMEHSVAVVSSLRLGGAEKYRVKVTGVLVNLSG